MSFKSGVGGLLLAAGLTSAALLSGCSSSDQGLEVLLGSRPHRAAYEYPSNVVKYSGVDSYKFFSPSQTRKVTLLTNQLCYDSRFRRFVGEALGRDFRDRTREYGGLAVYSDYRRKNFRLEMIPSLLTNKAFLFEEITHGRKRFSQSSDQAYVFPNEALRDDFAFLFHFHASKSDCSSVARPSLLNSGFFFGDCGGDIGFAIREVKRKGFSDQLVFSKLSGSSFNTHYFGGFVGDDGSPVIFVLDLGDYSFD